MLVKAFQAIKDFRSFSPLEGVEHFEVAVLTFYRDHFRATSHITQHINIIFLKICMAAGLGLEYRRELNGSVVLTLI